MDDAEVALSRCTPGYRFDAAIGAPGPAPTMALAVAPAAADAEAAEVVAREIDGHPVVMFALEWCEFCWAARKLLARLGVAYRSVDLDAVAWQRDDLGTRMRAPLRERAGAPTIPQIWIGGRHGGGGRGP